MYSIKTTAFALAASALLNSASAHSWVEQMQVIAPNGTFVGAPGFARGNVKRQGSANVDEGMVYLLPPNGRNPPALLDSDPMCFPGHQQNPVQTDGSPRLQAAAGDMVALRYQENGHVTLPQNQPGKPANRGTVYVYGTTQSSSNDRFLDIFNKWNAEGSGGNKKGKLLASFNFDDTQCHQTNSGAISTQRQKQFPHKADQLMGADLWCQNDLKLPQDAPAGKPYTLYWVWDWPTAKGTPGQPEGKTEIYTTCMDIDIKAASGSDNKASSSDISYKPQDLGDSAVAAQLSAVAANKPMIAPTALPAGPNPAGDDKNLQTRAQTAAPAAASSPNAAPAPNPAPAPAPNPAPAPSPAAQGQAPAPGAASPAIKTVTEAAKTVTKYVQGGAPTGSTKMITVPKSTKVVAPTAAPQDPQEPGVPKISLSNSFTGVATPVSADSAAPTGNATASSNCKGKRASKIFSKNGKRLSKSIFLLMPQPQLKRRPPSQHWSSWFKTLRVRYLWIALALSYVIWRSGWKAS